MIRHLFKDFSYDLAARSLSQQRSLCVAAQISSFRTSESNPINHDENHASRFYTVPPDIKNKLYKYGGFSKLFQEQIKTFRETCFMVRSPALELIQYLKATDFTRPAVRYVLHGETGSGKTVTMAHVLHYGYMSGFLIIHAPVVPNWMRICKEVSNSETREGFVNLNLDASSWLIHFQSQNAALLNKLDLRLSKEYVWSKREISEAGAPLTDLIELGIKRVKYASECVVAIVKEIKHHSTEGRCKTLVFIEGFNAFFHPRTRIVTEDKVKIPPWRVTLTEAFMDISKFDWCNGAVIVTVDMKDVPDDRRETSLPVYQLGREGFEHLDPFVPVHVPYYSDMELESCLDYYIDRRWLQNENSCSPEGRHELKFLCGMNPRRLMNICGPL